MANNFRELFRWLLPSWLHEGEGGLVAFSLASLKDIYIERVYQGLVARFPSYAAGDALAEIGRERGLKNGFDEPHESYVSRLQAWRVPKTHRVRGTAFAALREAQISAGQGTWIRTIDHYGTEHKRTADGVETYTYFLPWFWDGESLQAKFWLEARDVPGAAANAYTDLSALWTRADGNETLGIDGVTPRRMSDIRDLFSQAPQWKPAGTRAVFLIVNLTGDPVMPDGMWGRWSKTDEFGITVRARDDAFRYVQLTPTKYAGDPTRFPRNVTLPTGIVYEGDPTNASAWYDILLPRLTRTSASVTPMYRGRTDFPKFRGNPATPVGIRLPDDGDLVPNLAPNI